MKELYFDISSAQSGGSLFRVTQDGKASFYYNHSTYDDTKDDLKVFESWYASFDAFWKELLEKNKDWFYLHPLFVHPEQRDFVREQLRSVNWDVHPNKKWQDSHQRQWKKVLTGPGDYYRQGE